MTNDGLSRRRVLAGVGSAGLAGSVLGSGTAALFADLERFEGNLLGAGTIDLLVAAEAPSGRTVTSEGKAAFGVDPTANGGTGSIPVTVSLPEDRENNPAYAWVRSTCPDGTDLAEALSVTLRYDGACVDDDAPGVIAAGTLTEVADALRGGVALDPDCDTGAAAEERDCLEPGETVDLALEWELDETYNDDGSTSVVLEFVGTQCRYADGGENPFPSSGGCIDRHGISSIEVFADLDTDGDGEGDGEQSLGKLELDEPCPGLDTTGDDGEGFITTGRYDLPTDDLGDCSDSGYDLVVTETTTKTEGGTTETTGVAFRVVENDGDAGPDITKVVIKGSDAVTYGPDSLDGAETSGVLFAPTKDGGEGPSGNGRGSKSGNGRGTGGDARGGGNQ